MFVVVFLIVFELKLDVWMISIMLVYFDVSFYDDGGKY